jgi:hypothetical protein
MQPSSNQMQPKGNTLHAITAAALSCWLFVKKHARFG